MSRHDDTDPTGWSDERLLAHAERWCDLPALPGISRTMTDQDVQDHSDMLHIGGLVDDLLAAKIELQNEIREFQAEHGQLPAEPMMWLAFLAHSAEALPHTTFSFTPSWNEALAPMLVVGEEIAGWGRELTGEAEAA